MKHLNYILSISVCFVFLSNCQKAPDLVEIEQLKENQKAFSSIQDDDEYETMLNTIALSLFELSKEKDFRKLVYDEASKQFDGDDNVLLKVLNNYVPDLSLKLFNGKQFRKSKKIYRHSNMKSQSNFNSFNAMDKIEKIINGYSSGKYKWYTQIYIPNIKNINIHEIPTIGLVFNDEMIIPAYRLEENGDVILQDLDLQKKTNDLIWIISVNERTNDAGEVLDSYVPTNLSNPGLRADPTSIRIMSSIIRSRHESSGKSEITFIAAHGNNSCITNQVLGGQPYLTTDQMNIRFNHAVSDGLTYMAISNSSPLISGECLDFILFERDPPRSSNQHAWVYNDCWLIQSTAYWNSYSGEYGNGSIICHESLPPVPTWTIFAKYNWVGEAELELGYIRF